MKRLAILVLALSTMLGVATAQAATITHIQDWGGPSGDQTFTDSAPPQWTHTINFTPDPAASISSATLELRHKGNVGSSFFGEVWVMSTQGNVSIGDLSNSNFILDFYTTQTFNLPTSLFPSVPATSWVLALKLGETTGGTDRITLDWAKLNVNYAPLTVTQTPEPATLTLLGTGFAAAMWRRRRQRRSAL